MSEVLCSFQGELPSKGTLISVVEHGRAPRSAGGEREHLAPFTDRSVPLGEFWVSKFSKQVLSSELVFSLDCEFYHGNHV